MLLKLELARCGKIRKCLQRLKITFKQIRCTHFIGEMSIDICSKGYADFVFAPMRDEDLKGFVCSSGHSSNCSCSLRLKFNVRDCALFNLRERYPNREVLGDSWLGDNTICSNVMNRDLSGEVNYRISRRIFQRQFEQAV